MIKLYKNYGSEVDGSFAGVLHVDTIVVIYCLQANCTWTQIPQWSQGQFLWGYEKQLQQIIDGHIRTQTYQKDSGYAHELAPQCAWTYSWAECQDGVYLCGLPTERPRWVIPAAVLSHSKRMTTGWLTKPLSSICLIWAFCLHLSSAPRLKAAALPLFASLLGSEENDNNEAWRLSTASHTNIQTYNTRNTDDAANADTHGLTHSVL